MAALGPTIWGNKASIGPGDPVVPAATLCSFRNKPYNLNESVAPQIDYSVSIDQVDASVLVKYAAANSGHADSGLSVSGQSFLATVTIPGTGPNDPTVTSANAMFLKDGRLCSVGISTTSDLETTRSALDQLLAATYPNLP